MATRDTTGSGRAGTGSGPDIGEAFGAATRDYFEAMARALRGAAGGATTPADPWRAVFDAWSTAAGGRSGFGDGGQGAFARNPFAQPPFAQNPFAAGAFPQGMFGQNPFGQSPFGQSPFGQSTFGQSPFATGSFGDGLDAVVGRFAEQGRQWFGRMQALVERFSGGDAAPTDIAQAWKAMLGGDGANPFADLFAQMGGRGHAGFDQWFAQVAPLLRAGWADAWMGEGAEWLSLPVFGPAREHQERAQTLGRALLALQEANDGYHALMFEAGRDAFVRFERKLGERSEPGRQLKSARALFDLWIDAAEEAYADVALSTEFRRRYAALVDAQMRVRAGVQDLVERMTAQFGMPTRTEVDAAHRRIAQLERELRRLQRGGAAGAAPSAVKRGAAAKTATDNDGVAASRAEPANSAVSAVSAEQAVKTAPSEAEASARVGASPRTRDARRVSAPERAVSAVAKPRAAKPGPTKPDRTKPATTKSGTTKPASARPVAAKRRATEAASRSAAPRAKPAAARRAARAFSPALSSAMPQAPEPMPARATGKAARAPRAAGASAAKPAKPARSR